MSLTSLEIMLVKLRTGLNDLGVKRWTEVELIGALNEGKNELVKLIRGVNEDYFEKTVTATISVVSAPNPSDITLPTDFASLKNIRITTTGYEDIPFRWMDHSDPRFDRALVDGPDSGGFFYDILGADTLRLAPGSDVELACALDYIAVVSDMELLGDEPTGVPREDYDWIITWAMCECLRSAGDERLVSYEAKLEWQTVRAVESAARRQVREPRHVRGYMEEEEAYW